MKRGRHLWRCKLCSERGFCETGLLALAEFEKHYAAKHRED